MLARWTEILPVFVVRWLALRYCERVGISREFSKRGAAVARPDLLIVFPSDVGQAGTQQLTDAQILARKPVCADFVSFRAGIRSIELDLGIHK